MFSNEFKAPSENMYNNINNLNAFKAAQRVYIYFLIKRKEDEHKVQIFKKKNHTQYRKKRKDIISIYKYIHIKELLLCTKKSLSTHYLIEKAPNNNTISNLYCVPFLMVAFLLFLYSPSNTCASIEEKLPKTQREPDFFILLYSF